MPAGLSFVQTTDAFPDAFGCNTCEEGEEANWLFNSIAAGGSRTIVVNASVLSGLQGGSLIDAMIFVSFDNAASSITRLNVTGVNNNPFSQLAVSVSNDPVEAGQEFTVTVDAGNISSQNLTNGSITLCLLYTSPSPRDATLSRMPSSA